GELALREGAEAAAEVADVRVVDVAGDDVADRLAVDLAAQRVGGGEDAVHLVAARAEEPGDLLLAELVARVDRERVLRRERHGQLLAGSPALAPREARRVCRPRDGGRERERAPAVACGDVL